MTDLTHMRRVTAWLADLANLTSGISANVDAKAKIGSIAATLADAFPEPECFTRESLTAIAKQNGMFPGFGTLHTQLAAWWADHKPRRFTPPVELAAAAMTPEDRAQVASWLRSRDTREAQMQLAVVRRYTPNGFEWLVQHDLIAASIAVKSGWSGAATEHSQAREAEEDWKSPAIVREITRKYWNNPEAMRLLSGLVAKWAPENLEVVEDVAAECRERQPQAAECEAAR